MPKVGPRQPGTCQEAADAVGKLVDRLADLSDLVRPRGHDAALQIPIAESVRDVLEIRDRTDDGAADPVSEDDRDQHEKKATTEEEKPLAADSLCQQTGRDAHHYGDRGARMSHRRPDISSAHGTRKRRRETRADDCGDVGRRGGHRSEHLPVGEVDRHWCFRGLVGRSREPGRRRLVLHGVELRGERVRLQVRAVDSPVVGDRTHEEGQWNTEDEHDRAGHDGRHKCHPPADPRPVSRPSSENPQLTSSPSSSSPPPSGSTSRTPTPWIVRRYRDCVADSPSLRRSHEMWTSTVLSLPP